MTKIPVTKQELNKIFFRVSMGNEKAFTLSQKAWEELKTDENRQKLLDLWFSKGLISISMRDILK